MPKYIVSGDLLVPFLVEVEAASEDEAELRVEAMNRHYLLARANTEEAGMAVSVDGVTQDEPVGVETK